MPRVSENTSDQPLLRDDAEARFKAIVDAAVDGIVVIDLHGIVQVFNVGAEQIFGYPAKDIVGKNVSVLMPPPDRDHHDRYISSYVDGASPKIIGIGREVVGLRSNGERFPMELSVGDASIGTRRQFVGIVKDISTLRVVKQCLVSFFA